MTHPMEEPNIEMFCTNKMNIESRERISEKPISPSAYLGKN
jgi:hypothetical protein